MKGPLNDIFGLFFPRVCAMCGGTLSDGASFVCPQCRWEMPLTGFRQGEGNPVARMFDGKVPIEGASAYMFFVHDSPARSMIHRFKYQGGWKFALKAGEWYGAELAGSCDGIDLVIPIPLHLRKRLTRGYNQAEYIARGISTSTGIALDTHSVVRSTHNPSQARRTKSERWENVSDIFAVRDPKKLAGRHILLVDDVLTTGATLTSCACSILAAVPDCRISIAALAVSKNELDRLR